MKKIFALIMMLTCSIALAGCGQSRQVTITVPDTIRNITITPCNSEEMTFQYTDARWIKEIVTYISGLGTLTTSAFNPEKRWVSEVPSQYADIKAPSDPPIYYKITASSIYGDVGVYYQWGNYFKQGDDGEWCELDPETAATFENILQEREPSVFAEKQLFWDVFITVPENVTRVIVAPSNREDMTFEYTEAEKVAAFVKYFSDLGKMVKSDQDYANRRTDMKPEQGDPMSYKVTLCTEDGDEEEYYLLRSTYLKQGAEGLWCWLRFDKGFAFDRLIQQYEPDVPAENLLYWEVSITVPENVTEVIIAPSDNEATTFKYTEPQKIEAIVAYISGLNPLMNTRVQEPIEYTGMVYKITLCGASGETQVYYHRSNLFFKQGEDGQWCDIYGKGGDFNELLKGIEPDVPAEKPLFSNGCF